jgi:DNA-binding IscR family transcriptional regulator
MTSDEIGAMLGTNPVVVRRTMAGLRARGYVSSEKVTGGGWRLARPLEQLTLLDIYEAIGEPAMFAAALRKAAMERAEAYRVHIEWALSHRGGAASRSVQKILRECWRASARHSPGQ